MHSFISIPVSTYGEVCTKLVQLSTPTHKARGQLFDLLEESSKVYAYIVHYDIYNAIILHILYSREENRQAVICTE